MSAAAKFRDLSVSAKVMGVLAFVLVATVALGLYAIQRLSAVDANTVEIRAHWLKSTEVLGDLQYSATRFQSWNGAALGFSTDAQRDEARKNLDALQTATAEALRQYQDLAATDKERAMASDIADKWSAFYPMAATALDTGKSQGQAAAVAYYLGPMAKAFVDLKDSIDGAIAYNTQMADAAGAAGRSTFVSARLWILIAVGLALLICVFAATTLVKSVSSPLVEMTKAMSQLAAGNLEVSVPATDQQDEIGKLAEAMLAFKHQLADAERSKAEQTGTIVSSIGAGLSSVARGDLTHRITAELTGPFAKLKQDFNEAISRLQDTLRNILTSTGGISTGAGEISQAADDLSRRTEQQAASLEQTAAALEQITATVKQTAANSKQASASVAVAKTAAEEGGRVVEAAIKAMGQIEQSSKQITDIIGVIDEIAFQTNLLALNAGVEAARAGDAGKGFAVVASEVRGLAQRSSEAAKEIKGLIKSSSEHVLAGVKSVGASGEALQRIVDQVMQINSLVTEMAQAADQQSSGIEQVNVAVSQMDQVTQQNAAMVEQSTAATRNLAAETQGLTDLVGFFAVGEAKAAARPGVRRPQPQQANAAARPQRHINGSGGKQATVAVARRPDVEPDADDWTEF